MLSSTPFEFGKLWSWIILHWVSVIQWKAWRGRPATAKQWALSVLRAVLSVRRGRQTPPFWHARSILFPWRLGGAELGFLSTHPGVPLAWEPPGRCQRENALWSRPSGCCRGGWAGFSPRFPEIANREVLLWTVPSCFILWFLNLGKIYFTKINPFIEAFHG